MRGWLANRLRRRPRRIPLLPTASLMRSSILPPTAAPRCSGTSVPWASTRTPSTRRSRGSRSAAPFISAESSWFPWSPRPWLPFLSLLRNLLCPTSVRDVQIGPLPLSRPTVAMHLVLAPLRSRTETLMTQLRRRVLLPQTVLPQTVLPNGTRFSMRCSPWGLLLGLCSSSTLVAGGSRPGVLTPLSRVSGVLASSSDVLMECTWSLAVPTRRLRRRTLRRSREVYC